MLKRLQRIYKHIVGARARSADDDWPRTTPRTHRPCATMDDFVKDGAFLEERLPHASQCDIRLDISKIPSADKAKLVKKAVRTLRSVFEEDVEPTEIYAHDEAQTQAATSCDDLGRRFREIFFRRAPPAVS